MTWWYVIRSEGSGSLVYMHRGWYYDGVYKVCDVERIGMIDTVPVVHMKEMVGEG